jgi:hypothetical protein
MGVDQLKFKNLKGNADLNRLKSFVTNIQRFTHLLKAVSIGKDEAVISHVRAGA